MNVTLGRLKQRATEYHDKKVKGKSITTNVLPSDILELDEKLNIMRTSYEQLSKNIESLGYSKKNTPMDRRLPKIPHDRLGHSMSQCGVSMGEEGDLGSAFSICGESQHKIALILAGNECELDGAIIQDIQNMLDTDFRRLASDRKELENCRLDLDASRNRLNNSPSSSIDKAQDNFDEANSIFEERRDKYASDLTDFMCREEELVAQLISFIEIQTNCFRKIYEEMNSSLENLKAINNHRLFGHTVEAYSSTHHQNVPTIVEHCIYGLDEHIEEEGIFRMSGQLKSIKRLRHLFNRQDPKLDLRSTEWANDPHAISGVLKLYFREMPDPLLLSAFYDNWLHASNTDDHDEKLYALKDLLDRLPQCNYDTLKCLMRFLVKVSRRSKVNKMASSNLGIVFGPTLLRSGSGSDMAAELADSHALASVVEYFISYYDWLFEDDGDAEIIEYVYFDPHAPTTMASPKVERKKTDPSNRKSLLSEPRTPVADTVSAHALTSHHSPPTSQAKKPQQQGFRLPSMASDDGSGSRSQSHPNSPVSARPAIPKRGQPLERSASGTKHDNPSTVRPERSDPAVATRPERTEPHIAARPERANSRPERTEPHVAARPERTESHKASRPERAEPHVAARPERSDSHKASRPERADPPIAARPERAEPTVAARPPRVASRPEPTVAPRPAARPGRPESPGSTSQPHPQPRIPRRPGA